MLNYEYSIDLAKRLTSNASCLLDYGCGAGQIVENAISAGFDAYGVEEFYEGGSYRDEAKKRGLLGTRIFELNEGRIPFDTDKFDVIISNQVFEHIDDFTKPLFEINRVLKPSGIFINIFPSVDVWREGHIGIPFIHWFTKGTRTRFYYALALRAMGLGFYKEGKSIREWTSFGLDWIDKWTHYKPLTQIEQNFGIYFTNTFYDTDYILFRIRKHKRLSMFLPIFEWNVFRPFLKFVCSRFASRIFVMRKCSVDGKNDS